MQNAVGKLGYALETTPGRVFTNKQGDTVPLFRMYSGRASDHFYTYVAVFFTLIRVPYSCSSDIARAGRRSLSAITRCLTSRTWTRAWRGTSIQPVFAGAFRCIERTAGGRLITSIRVRVAPPFSCVSSC